MWGRGERKGLESGGRYKTGSPEDLIPCSLCPRNAKERHLQEQGGSMPVNDSAPKGSTFCSPARRPALPVSLCPPLSAFHFSVCFGASEQPLPHPGSREINITVETNSLDSTYSD